MQELIQFEKIDTRLGYKMTSGNEEMGSFRFIGGAWNFRTPGADWVPVGAPWFLAAQLREFAAEEGCAVMLWRCCACSKFTPGGREFDAAVKAAGGNVTHGYCDEHFAEFFPADALAA